MSCSYTTFDAPIDGAKSHRVLAREIAFERYKADGDYRNFTTLENYTNLSFIKMPRDKCTHGENRKKVCAPCGQKIKFGKIKPEKFLVNNVTQNLIKKFINSDYDVYNEQFPLAICRTCYLTLLDAEKNLFKRPMQVMPNYFNVLLPKETRAKKETCDCYICSTARFTGHRNVLHGRGNKRNLNNAVNTFKDPHSSFTEEELPSTSVENKKPKSFIQLCNECFQEIGKGKVHICKNAKNNVVKIVERLTEKEQDQIVTTIIKKKVESEIREGSSSKNVDFNLSTGGRKTRIIMNPNKEKHYFFNEENLDNFRINLGASANAMKRITNFLRTSVGKKSVPAYYSKHMTEKSTALKDVYKVSKLEFECEKSLGKQIRSVVYANAEELLDTVIEKRKFEGNVVIKVMADGGQGFFKICLTVAPENYFPKPHTDFDEDGDYHLILNESASKRSLYSQGGNMAKQTKLTSVNKLILLCIVPQIKESYDNVKLLFDLTNINNIAFKFVSDFKLLLIVNGQQTASAMFPCPYCFISLKELRGDRNSQDRINDVAHRITDDSLENENPTRLKTYGDLKTDYQKFCRAGNNKKYSAESHSTINPPLFNENDNIYILQKCIIPELHILQGFVNHLFWKGLVPLLGREKALIWPQKMNVVVKNYHGDSFEGNACRTLLKRADKLNDAEIYNEVGYFKIIPYIAAYKAMDKIVNCYFTSGKIGESIDSHILDLHNALKSIDDLSVTVKLHVLISHLRESLQFSDDDKGLGFWSEQAGESAHREFLKFWERYKINNIHDETYSSRLLKAVVEFTSYIIYYIFEKSNFI